MKRAGKVVLIALMLGSVIGIIGINIYYLVQGMNTKETLDFYQYENAYGLQEGEDIPVAEMIIILQDLGFYEVEEAADTLVNAWIEVPEEIQETYPKGESAAYILSYLGQGEWNYDTWEWTPISKQVYSFDTEVFNVADMYKHFLKGVESISGGELVMEDIQEALPEELYPKRAISFTCNGHTYKYSAMNYGDWFDMKFISFMNEVIITEGKSKKLYTMTDGYQTCILVYQTPEWVKEFEEKTGQDLSLEME